jgi:hypothetical protein
MDFWSKRGPSFLIDQTMKDERKVVGNIITAKAKHVSNSIEFQRLSGSNWKTKEVYGVFVDVGNIVNDKTKSKKTMITATFTLSKGSLITKKTHLTNLKHFLHGDLDEITLESLAFESGPTQYHQQQKQVLDSLLPTETTTDINLTIPKTNSIITTNITMTTQLTYADIIENGATEAILEI